MKFSVKWIWISYWFVVVAELVLIYFNKTELRWFTKPLLMPLLMAAVWMHRKHTVLFQWILAALFLSWAGDIFLQMKGLFIPGLASFLLAHICYILYFIWLKKNTKGLLQLQPFIGIPVVVYILIFLYILYPFLSALKIPVTIYGITIGIMLLMSINTKRKLNRDAAALFFNGAFQFVLSDSILAVNMFAFPSMVLSICVMITYASAQYLIVRGSLIAER